MNTDEYNGWANRETWAFNLHWQNDQGLYVNTLQYATGLLNDEDTNPVEISDRNLGESVVAFWREAIDYYDETDSAPPAVLRMMDREVGSWWRIDYAETGAAVRESLENES